LPETPQAEDLKDYFLKEIEIIEDIISRMANNSFLIKGWTITLVVISMLLSQEPKVRLFSIIPCIFFWGLDAYYLWLEKLYRALFDWVIANRLNTNAYLFDLNARTRFSSRVDNIFKVMVSPSLLLFYLGLMILIFFLNK